jgi:hypothetical protein
MASNQIPCTAPLNIVKNIQTEKICKLKCAYGFTYPSTSLQIGNYGTFLLFTPDETSAPPVIYNDMNYNVQYCVLAQPSIHHYNSNRADAELIIVHNRVSGNPLYVCIPIKNSSTSTAQSSNYFDMIMSNVSQTASSRGGRTVFTNSTFSLNKFVPMTPYFSYSGTNMFSLACNSREGTVDYLVYRGGVFYNPSGPTPPNQPEIYIDCQPTGDDGELLVVAKKDTTSFLDNKLIKNIMSSDILSSGIKIIIGLILMIFLWKVIMSVIQGITANAVSVKPMPPPKK